MKATVDRLSVKLTERYIQYLEAFLVDLWSEAGRIEFRCGFALRSDHILHRFQLDVPAIAGDTDEDRNVIVGVIFEQIEDVIDRAIAENRTATH